jgi:hypothetical protein
MWQAMKTVATPDKDDGLFFIMVYPNLGSKSSVWRVGLLKKVRSYTPTTFHRRQLLTIGGHWAKKIV